MNREELKTILPHREPMLLLDEAVRNEDGSATAYYTVRGDAYRQILGVSPRRAAVWTMLEPIMPAAPTIRSFSSVKNFMIFFEF